MDRRSFLKGLTVIAATAAIPVTYALSLCKPKWVNVKDYGALGDGVADDLLPLYRAIEAARNGGTVYLPPGTYKVSALLTR